MEFKAYSKGSKRIECKINFHEEHVWKLRVVETFGPTAGRRVVVGSAAAAAAAAAGKNPARRSQPYYTHQQSPTTPAEPYTSTAPKRALH